jgi:hypothetical protein
VSEQRSGPEQISSKEQDDFDFALYFLDLLCRNVIATRMTVEDAALAMARMLRDERASTQTVARLSQVAIDDANRSWGPRSGDEPVRLLSTQGRRVE